LDIEMHNTLDITNMTQKEIEDAIHSVISGEKTFAEVAAENPGPIVAEKVDDSDGELTLIENEEIDWNEDWSDDEERLFEAFLRSRAPRRFSC
jgi:hypothetical protein